MPTIVENGNTYLYFLEPIKQYKEKTPNDHMSM